MPRLPRFSSWDILSRAFLPKDIKPPPARSIRFGRPLPRLRIKLGSRAFSIPSLPLLTLALLALYSFVQSDFVAARINQSNPAAHPALKLGTTVLIFAVVMIMSFRCIDPGLVASSRVRTAEIRRALAMHRRGAFNAETAAQLTQHLTARSRQLAIKREHGLLEPGGIRVVWHNQSHRLILIVAIFLPQLIRDYAKDIDGLHMPFLLSPMLALVALYLHGSLLPARLARAAVSQHCPDCSYPLGDLPTPFNGAPGPPIRSGPERCPECGTPWPMIPPRLP